MMFTGLDSSTIKIYGNRNDIRKHLYKGKVEPVSAICDGGEPYIDDAFIPKSKFSHPTTLELDQLRSNKPFCPHTSVGLLRIPESIVNDLRKTYYKNIEENVKDQGELPTWPEILSQISSISANSTGVPLGISRRPKGLVASTFDSTQNKRLGLHVDNWDQLNYSMRDESRNRICINLGADARYFLFSPFTIKEIYEAIEATPNFDPSHLAGSFFKNFPEAPVIKLRILPGWGYIAPTDNIIHDGSTDTGKDQNDITAAWLGNISLARKL